MEIGNTGQLSTYEKEYYTKKAIGLSITAFLLIFIISFFIIANYTSLFERKIFEKISDKYDYKLSYSNTYEVLASKNSDQGNYIQLTDPENQIYILFRFDEQKTSIVDIFDSLTNTKSLYTVNTKMDSRNQIRSEENILYNIDREFSPLSYTGVKGDSDNIGGGYSIIKLDTILNQHRIEYMSNLLEGISKKDKENTAMVSDDVLPVKNWFNYNNSINYQLGILKAIVETETEYDSSKQIMYSGSNASATIIDDVSDMTEESSETYTEEEKTGTEDEKSNNKKLIDKSLEGFINNKDDILAEYGDMAFSTYTSLVLSNDDTQDTLLNKSEKYPDGVIIGTCLNKVEAVNKMTTTMNLLIILSYLERTMIL